jgi:hypothetical protein
MRPVTRYLRGYPTYAHTHTHTHMLVPPRRRTFYGKFLWNLGRVQIEALYLVLDRRLSTKIDPKFEIDAQNMKMSESTYLPHFLS